ncbi:hypothetical protein [Crenothrix polyspora]|uniref:MSHA biogenesis protein MshP n=1 Tax=Crenothrix polyspora TaxID=360316 RepID=A0A1R4HHH4_9GAMM|nr:hypothetical protein [Crenothrix polyspora]SJM95330.1 hypothetical protein CRENPOLYSF1_670046 [Crenothrix polyspora]
MKIHGNQSKQRGDSLLLSLFMLLLMTLGFVATLRVVKNDVQTTGALGWHTRGKQASEVVLQQTLPILVVANISSQLWYRTGTNPNVPTAAYWSSCNGNADTTLRCDKTTKNGFNVYRIVQEAPASDCKYYRIFLHAVESSGVGSQVDSEAVYRLC